MLRGVAEAKEIQTFHGTLEERVQSERVKEWRNILKSHYNYFKHADRDPERFIEDFSPDATTWALFAAQVDYYTIYKKRTWPMLVYHIWFLCRYPSIVYDEGKEFVELLSRGLNFPEGKPLREAVAEASKMIENGRKNPEILRALGPSWLAIIESE
jgi:hypothetical protein